MSARSTLIGFTIAYFLSIVAVVFAISSQDKVTKVDNHVQRTVTQRLDADASKLCRPSSPQVKKNCRALIERLIKSSTAQQRRRIAGHLIGALSKEDLKKLGVQPVKSGASP